MRVDIPKRIYELQEQLKEEDSNSPGISKESIKQFYDFMAFLDGKLSSVRPQISLTPDNKIYAKWNIPELGFLSLHFKGREIVSVCKWKEI